MYTVKTCTAQHFRSKPCIQHNIFTDKIMYTAQHLYSQNHAYSTTFLQSKPCIQYNIYTVKTMYTAQQLYSHIMYSTTFIVKTM